jgi:uncharacterized GH25 family protein
LVRGKRYGVRHRWEIVCSRFPEKLAARYQVFLNTDPRELHKGSLAHASVVYDGKPHNTQVLSTYEGFSDQTETYAYATRSNDGQATIQMLENGKWLIKASDTFPYPDTKKADVYSFTSTITFAVQ